jgi:L-ascorbate metabolism protein UlaG (beta-lactamase superfamily)
VTGVRLTHIGGPTVLVEAAGWTVLVDPTFDPPGRRYSFGWGSSSVKQVGPAVAADDLPPLDVVLLTHDQHADNLDDAGRALLPDAGTVLTTAAGARRLGGGAVGLVPWASTVLEHPDRPTITVTATPCRHGPPGSRPIVGDVVGFALQWEGQVHGDLWITGDTVLTRSVRDAADRLVVGTVLLHLGKVQFGITGPLRYTMTAADAVELVGLLQPHTAIPVHYEGWSHFHEGREAIEPVLASAPATVRDAVRWLAIGEPADIEV